MRHLAYIECDLEAWRRGDSCRVAACLCGWRGPPRSVLELVVADVVAHERGAALSRRMVLIQRVAANKGWLLNNLHLGKDVRRSCNQNIEADERELRELDQRLDLPLGPTVAEDHDLDRRLDPAVAEGQDTDRDAK
jgi:hypothetical protein